MRFDTNDKEKHQIENMRRLILQNARNAKCTTQFARCFRRITPCMVVYAVPVFILGISQFNLCELYGKIPIPLNLFRRDDLMARIIVLTHEYDDFANMGYLIEGLFKPWKEMGHSVRVVQGIASAVDADIVIMHTDLSVVPDEYINFAAQIPVGINRNATDIRKRLVSRILLNRGDEWDGPVIVKSDLNCRGAPEWQHNQCAQQHNRPAPYPSVDTMISYSIYHSLKMVPETAWTNPNVVVERFQPERDEKGFWLRCWVFFGDIERCNKFCCPDPIVKAGNAIARERAPVPDELRNERVRLGFDYGKFDFVINKGQVILLDANRTPTGATGISQYQESSAFQLAQGINTFLGGAHAWRK